jgi:predicted kinase
MSKKLVVLVGPPGSGKSTLAQQFVADGYIYINQDTQGKEHLHNFDMAIVEGRSIVVDRMNFNRQQRSRYLGLAKEHGYETTITVIHQPRQVCLDRMRVRENHPTIKDSAAANSALNTFFSKYERPERDEADNVNFIYPSGAKDLAIIVDLDGTLCNIDHRLHYVKTPEGVKKNWKAFFANLINDVPNEWCAEIVRAMDEYYPIVFASGRPDDHEYDTRYWLEQNDFPTNHLYMRCRGDHRQDFIAKEIILDFEILTRFKPLFFVDDRKQVADLWRRRGFTCLQCAEGDF